MFSTSALTVDGRHRAQEEEGPEGLWNEKTQERKDINLYLVFSVWTVYWRSTGVFVLTLKTTIVVKRKPFSHSFIG